MSGERPDGTEIGGLSASGSAVPEAGVSGAGVSGAGVSDVGASEAGASGASASEADASEVGQLHIPVLCDEVIVALSPQPGDVIVDATFGAGGYTRRLLDAGAMVHAFDRDPDAIEAGREWPETREDPPRLILHQRRFSEMQATLAGQGVERVDAVVMDIGVSSMQLDNAERGFAFSADGPLDMRMAQEGETAADFINNADEAEIADVLYLYGEERQSRRVARAIVAARPLTTTGDLARILRSALGYRAGARTGSGRAQKDPATRSFQAIRIHVNGELEELRGALHGAEQLLGENGRLAVVSFHSLEDRIVKNYLKDASARTAGSRHLPEQPAGPQIYTQLSKAIKASAQEVARNPRARSAVLRHALRSDAPARRAA